jgi:signal peptidase
MAIIAIPGLRGHTSARDERTGIARSGAARAEGAGTAARIVSALGKGLSFLGLVVASLAAIVLIAIPMLTGSAQYSVLTSSMKPTYPPGTLLVVKPVDFAALAPGDVVTYQITSGESAVITHRVISSGVDQQGARVLFTQGDNNSVADPEPVQEVQVRGKLFYAVPFAGFAANWLGNQDRGLLTQAAAFGLIGYGVFSVLRGATARARARKSTADKE